MRKIISAIICVMMIFTCISCTAAEPEIVPEYDSSIPEDGLDLNGAVIIIGGENGYEESGSTLGYIKDTDFGDLAAARVKEVEDKYNCTLKFEYIPSTGERAYNSAVAGVYLFDIVSQSSFGLLNYMRANAFVNLAELDNMDVFDQSKWGNRYMLISTMYDGGIFGVLPAALPLRIFASELHTIYINEDLISMLLETDPRDYFENGGWNWETFEKCLVNYAHTNNANEYVYSFASGFGPFARELGISNGNDFLNVKENGTYEIGYFSQTAIEAYNKAFDWYNGATASNVTEEDPFEKFVAQNAVMLFTDTHRLFNNTSSIAYQLENFGIVPVPVGPNAKDISDYKTTYSNAGVTYAIPITAHDPEISAFIMDKLFEPFEGFESEDIILEYLNRNYFGDERDSRYMIELTTGPHMRYHVHMEMSSMFDGMMSNGIMRSLESYEESIYEKAVKSAFPAYETLLQYEEYFHE